jgi:cysteine-rich repeat protein
MKKIKLICLSLGLVVISCTPENAIETETLNSSLSSSSESSSSIGNSQTSNSDDTEQVTTSGVPGNETSSSETSSSFSSSSSESSGSSSGFPEFCGNGEVNLLLEQCDDGNKEDFDECSNECLHNRFAFLTTNKVGLSNFGGINVANDLCQKEALDTNLKGVFKAWLSDENPENSPKFTFQSEDFVSWYVFGGFGFAKGWNDLIDGELVNSINIQSNGELDNESLVWTATNFDGSKNEKGACGNWNGIQTGPEFNVVIGKPPSLNKEWTEILKSCDDGISKKVYCFQVE